MCVFRFCKVLVSMSDGQNLTISPWLSKRTPPHRQGHDDDWLNRNRMQPQRSVVGDSGDEGEYVVPSSAYRGTHNQGNPFGRYRRKPSDKICRKMRYGLQVVLLQS